MVCMLLLWSNLIDVLMPPGPGGGAVLGRGCLDFTWLEGSHFHHALQELVYKYPVLLLSVYKE